MAITLGFHIVFACIGMTMPFLMVISHWIWLKKKNKIYLDLTRAWWLTHTMPIMKKLIR